MKKIFKKPFAVLTAVLMLLCMLPVGVFAAEAPKAARTEAPKLPAKGTIGDYDGNGEVNVQDAILTLRAAMGLITPSDQSLLNADMDGNGVLTVTDAITILRTAMGLTDPEANEPVTFHDPVFEAAFRNEYGYAPDEVITKGMLWSYTTLELCWCNLVDITDAAMFKNLIKLNLCGNEISDISPLAGLTGLTELDLSWQMHFHEEYDYGDFLLKDISPLAELTNLTKLNLSFNEISTLSPLSNLTKLTELELGNANISDITPLSGLINLTKLCLSNEEEDDTPWNSISDISPLAGLTKLTELYLTEIGLANVNLSNLPNLKILELDLNYSDSINLSNLPNLKILRLDCNEISDISSLAGLTNLTDLHLELNRISDISPLSGLTKLTMLDLDYNNLTSSTDVSPLFNLTLLENLDITDGNELTQAQIDAIQSHLPNCEIE